MIYLSVGYIVDDVPHYGVPCIERVVRVQPIAENHISLWIIFICAVKEI